MEVWKDIRGYEGMYQVSNLGKVKSLERWNGRHTVRERILRHNINKKGYHSVLLSKEGVAIRYEIHRLVGMNFISTDCECFNHLDGNKNDNSVFNLEASTFSENINHAVDVLHVHCRALQVEIVDDEGNKFKFGSMRKAEKFLNKNPHWLKQRRKRNGNNLKYEKYTITILE